MTDTSRPGVLLALPVPEPVWGGCMSVGSRQARGEHGRVVKKHERAVGAILTAFAAFFVIAAASSYSATSQEGSWATGFSTTASTIMIVLALVAAIPGFFLLFRRGAV